MKKNLGRVSRNESEEIRVSLRKVHGELHVELRVYGRSAHHRGAYLPEPEGIAVPVHVLSDLCRVLEQTHNHLVNEGLVDFPSLTTLMQGEAGDPVPLCLADPRGTTSDSRAEPRVPVRLPLECHLLSAPDTWPSKPLPDQVTGEIRVLSGGGALVRLPAQFPAWSRLAVFMRIGELIFRGQAEVVEVASHPKDGTYRHGLQWLSLSPQAQTALTKIIQTHR
ncbi:MAG: PilZ domain-containing protein [Candidatus Methylomirabilales bacterium]